VDFLADISSPLKIEGENNMKLVQELQFYLNRVCPSSLQASFFVFEIIFDLTPYLNTVGGSQPWSLTSEWFLIPDCSFSYELV